MCMDANVLVEANVNVVLRGSRMAEGRHVHVHVPYVFANVVLRGSRVAGGRHVHVHVPA